MTLLVVSVPHLSSMAYSTVDLKLLPVGAEISKPTPQPPARRKPRGRFPTGGSGWGAGG